MQGKLLELTANALAAHGVTRTSRVLAAVSGGPDSLALFSVLHRLHAKGTFLFLAAAHVDHALRPASALEARAVGRYAEEWGVPLHTVRLDTGAFAKAHKMGIEEAARTLRYRYFEDVAREHRFDFVLTAHTANDQAETLLMHIVRGAGVRGMSGIPPDRSLGSAVLLRPWLTVAKPEVLAYLRDMDLHASHDESNEDLSFQRNRVRHVVLPAMEAAWPDRSPVHALASLAERMRELSDYLAPALQSLLERVKTEGGLSIAELQALSGFPFHAVLEAWIETESPGYRLSSEETERIETWLATKPSALELRGGLRLEKDKQILRLHVR